MMQPSRMPLSLSVALMLAFPSIGVDAASAAPLETSRIPPDKVIEKEPDTKPIDGQYIVVLRADADPSKVASSIGAQVLHEYRAALNGFAAQLSDRQIQTLRSRDDVLFIEQDHEVTTQEVLQSSPPSWGLDRIDQRFLPLDGEYWYYTDAGNVHMYVIDTGVYANHVDFDGRVDTSPGGGFTAINDGFGTHDCNGHGTHVAGTAGSETYGVAKEVTIHPVRVLDCSGVGTFAGVLAGVNWVTANHVKPAVANMSLAGTSNLALDSAVNTSVAEGVFYAVAAANAGLDACSFSPAGAASAFTLGAMDIDDQRPSFSNFGPCVDLFAPGVGITSTWNTSPTATNTLPGTSMASPHAAGAAALHLAEYPLASPAEVRQALLDTATEGVVVDPGPGSPNLLLDSRLGSRAHDVSGDLTLVGEQGIHPLGSFFFARVDGPHEARLTGPATADFDLALFQYDPAFGFVQVNSSVGPTSDEHLIHHGPPGLYFWLVSNSGGSGSYDLTFSQP